MSSVQKSSPPPADAASKQRIINHMNADHSSQLSDYLQYYSRLPESLASTAELVDISLTQLTISTKSSPTGTTTTYIPIRPAPMESYHEARERMVYMANEAMEGLGKSPYIVDFYASPKGFAQWATVFGVCLGFYGFSFSSNFEKGAFIREYILFFSPTLADICEQYHLAWLILMLIIHFVESIHMEKSRLRKHGTPRFGLVWWQWIIGTFFEGFGSFLRFDQAVRRVKEKMMKEKH